jgi:hypothetical protein
MTPDFSSLYSAYECEMLQDAYDAITKCDLWDWMRTYTPHANEGFMFSTHPSLAQIQSGMKYTGHSGASWGWTMRTMESIAKAGGWDAFKASRPPPCPCRLAKGFTSGWCGVAGGGVPGCDH